MNRVSDRDHDLPSTSSVTRYRPAWNALDSCVCGFTLHKLNSRFESQEYAKMEKAFQPMIPADRFP